MNGSDSKLNVHVMALGWTGFFGPVGPDLALTVSGIIIKVVI